MANLTLRLRVLWENFSTGLTAENSFAFTVVDPLNESAAAIDLVAQFDEFVRPAYVLCVHGNYNITTYSVVKLPDKLTIYQTAAGNLSGALSGDQLPPQVAGVLSLSTARLGRRGKGRVYFPPANEAQNGSTGFPGGSYQGLMSDVGNALLAFPTYGDDYVFNPIVWSEADQDGYELTAALARGKWGTQRGRTR